MSVFKKTQYISVISSFFCAGSLVADSQYSSNSSVGVRAAGTFTGQAQEETLPSGSKRTSITNSDGSSFVVTRNPDGRLSDMSTSFPNGETLTIRAAGQRLYGLSNGNGTILGTVAVQANNAALFTNISGVSYQLVIDGMGNIQVKDLSSGASSQIILDSNGLATITKSNGGVEKISTGLTSSSASQLADPASEDVDPANVAKLLMAIFVTGALH